MIVAEGLARRFGRREVLRGLDLTAAAGDFLLVLGANGAGKTTLLRVLATLLRPSGGRARVAGADLQQEPATVRRSVGFVGHSPLLYRDVTVAENLRFYAEMYGVDRPRERSEELLEKVELSLRRDDPVRDLSRGMRQRAAIARALLHRPRVLLLDEPYAALDERARSLFDGILQEQAGRSTIVLVTHEPDRPSRWATMTLLLEGGTVTPVNGLRP